MSAEDTQREIRLRRLKFRAWHRGMREVDLLLGRYADAKLHVLNDNEIDQFEALMEVPDRKVLAWAIGEEDVPEESDTPLLRQIIAFHTGDTDT